MREQHVKRTRAAVGGERSGASESARRRTPRPRSGIVARAATAAAAVGALAAVTAPVAAAETCANEAVRVQQSATHLPNCRAYEKITPDSKSGETPGTMQITEDGSGLTFALNAGIADAKSFVGGRYRSLRSPDGRWATTALMPAMDGPVLPQLNAASDGPYAGTPDLSRSVLSTTYAIDPNDQGVVIPAVSLGTRDVFVREPDGGYRWLVPDPSVPDTSTADVFFAAASSDLERVVVGTTRPWDARVTDSFVNHLYVWTAHGTQLVTVLPNGDPATGLPAGEANDGTISGGTEASADARRIAFVDDGGAGDGRLYVRFNADDPATAFTREVGLAPDGETCTGAAGPKLSADGKHIVFSCYNRSLPGDPALRTYVRDLDGGADAVRLLGEGNGRVAGANADFSRVYLTGLNGTDGLYLSRDGGEAQPVAVPVSGTGISSARASVDGEYVAFDSTGDFGLPGVDHGSLVGGQAYLYAARTGTLTCVSCRQDGGTTDGVGSLRGDDVGGGIGGGGNVLYGMRPVSTRGTVTFSSTSALVPEDTNRQADAYAWVDGRAVLLSSGQSPRTSVAQGGSADGSSFFFRSTDALVPDDRDGGQYDLYAARVNGGVLVPESPAPCTSNCQGPSPERPAAQATGTTEPGGGGNAAPKRRVPTPRTTVTVSGPTSVRGSQATVRVKVSRAGSIRTSGRGLRTATVRATKAGTYRVTVRLSATGVKQQRTRGRLATRVAARFAPKSGVSVSASRSVTFTSRKSGR